MPGSQMPGSQVRGADLAVVIPTHGRPETLRRTLEAVAAQTVTGFDVTVVVDGRDQPAPDDAGIRVLVQDHAGPAAARNLGAATTERPLLLFLGDDMVPTPTLVERHLAVHERFPDRTEAVLGHVEWHPGIRRNRILRWLDWSTSQFDYDVLSDRAGQDVGFSRFYSCNVSLKRSLFESVGGFDEDFVFYYEDLDTGYRLGQAGMCLRYERDAVVEHLHDYDLAAIQRRFEGIARGERLMAAKHDWFEPWFLRRIQSASRGRTVSALWPRVVDLVPRGTWLRPRVERRANTWYHQRVAPGFLAEWERAREVSDLYRFLGDRFVGVLVTHPERADESTPEGRLHRLTAAAVTPRADRVLGDVSRRVQPGAPVLDGGEDTGSVGLSLAASGHEVHFLRTDRRLAEYLRWRLADRGLELPVHESADDVPATFDVGFAASLPAVDADRS